jgi:hypothetical protein
MENISTLSTEATEQERSYAPIKQLAATPATSASSAAENGGAYAVGGMICLIIGLFVLGIPLSLLAINLGRKAAERGLSTFGAIIQVAAWIELTLTLIALVASR